LADVKFVLGDRITRRRLINNFGGDSDCDSLAWHIAQDDSICAYPRMRADMDWPQNLCTCSDIDMTLDHRNAWDTASSNSHLLKDEAINTDVYAGINYDAVWMWDEEPSPDITIQRDLGSTYNGPKMVAQASNVANKKRYCSAPTLPVLTTSERKQQFAAWVPKSPGFLATPIGKICADYLFSSVLLSAHASRIPNQQGNSIP
jgi:hypothetical protein